jgi:ABC-type phosphate transport system substrate-binding protein
MKAKMRAAAACCLLLVASTSVQAGVVVVSKDSPFGAMDGDQVKRLFLGRDVSINGVGVTLLYQVDETTRDDFENKVLGKSGAELSTYWQRLIFTGRAKAPVEVYGGDAGVRVKLEGNPNAIGYVTDGGVDSSMKVIFKY